MLPSFATVKFSFPVPLSAIEEIAVSPPSEIFTLPTAVVATAFSAIAAVVLANVGTVSATLMILIVTALLALFPALSVAVMVIAKEVFVGVAS